MAKYLRNFLKKVLGDRHNTGPTRPSGDADAASSVSAVSPVMIKISSPVTVPGAVTRHPELPSVTGSCSDSTKRRKRASSPEIILDSWKKPKKVLVPVKEVVEVVELGDAVEEEDEDNGVQAVDEVESSSEGDEVDIVSENDEVDSSANEVDEVDVIVPEDGNEGIDDEVVECGVVDEEEEDVGGTGDGVDEEEDIGAAGLCTSDCLISLGIDGRKI